jgi:cytoskeletal protein CcmA (bactofilin family)
MFSKPTKGEGATQLSVTSARKVSVASLVADGVRIRGDMTTEGDLHLDGCVEGDLKVGRLTIGETGFVDGTVTAESIEIRGAVKGTVSARHVRLWATARVDGDISHAELSIEAGAHFEGRSLSLAPVAQAVEPLSVAAE